MLTQSPSQTIGPFFQFSLVRGGENILTNDQTLGQRIRILGTVFDGDGQPVPDALVEIWQADVHGIYTHPADPRSADADPEFRGFGRSPTVNSGRFIFDTVRPGSVQNQAPHVNVRVFSRGMLVHAVTRLYFSDETSNATDALLNSIDPQRRATLIAQLSPAQDAAQSSAQSSTQGVPTYHFDIHLQGENETLFFAP